MILSYFIDLFLRRFIILLDGVIQQAEERVKRKREGTEECHFQDCKKKRGMN